MRRVTWKDEDDGVDVISVPPAERDEERVGEKLAMVEGPEGTTEAAFEGEGEVDVEVGESDKGKEREEKGKGREVGEWGGIVQLDFPVCPPLVPPHILLRLSLTLSPLSFVLGRHPGRVVSFSPCSPPSISVWYAPGHVGHASINPTSSPEPKLRGLHGPLSDCESLFPPAFLALKISRR